MDRRRRRSGYQLLGPRKAGQCRVVGCGKYGTMLLHLHKHIRLNHSQMSPAEHSALPPPDPRKRVVAPSARGRTREACEIPTCPKYGDPTTKLKRHVEGRHGISMEVYHGYLKYLGARRSRQVDWERLITENGQSIGFSKVQCEAGDGGIHEPKAATPTRQDRRALELEPDFLLSALLEVFSEHTVTEAQNAGTGCRFAENPDANTSIFRLILNSKDCTVVKNSSNALLNSYLMSLIVVIEYVQGTHYVSCSRAAGVYQTRIIHIFLKSRSRYRVDSYNMYVYIAKITLSRTKSK